MEKIKSQVHVLKPHVLGHTAGKEVGGKEDPRRRKSQRGPGEGRAIPGVAEVLEASGSAKPRGMGA